MNISIVRFKDLNEQQIEKIARLHRSRLISLLTEMGLPFAKRFYRIACSDANTIGFCAMNVEDDILGFVMGHSKPWELSERLMHPVYWFLWQTAITFLRHPRVIWSILESRRENLTRNVYPSDTSVLLFIVVDDSAQGKGVGSVLIDCYIDASREMGFNKVALSVDIDNDQAVSFYQKLGFTVRDRIKQGRFVRDRLELDISRKEDD